MDGSNGDHTTIAAHHMDRPYLSTLSGRFKIRRFPGKLTPAEWTQLVKLKYLRIGVPEQAFWYSPSEEQHRQILAMSSTDFVSSVLTGGTRLIMFYLASIKQVWPHVHMNEQAILNFPGSALIYDPVHQDRQQELEKFTLYLKLFYDVVYYAVNCAKVLMNFIDNFTKQQLIQENENCDLAWMLRRLSTYDVSFAKSLTSDQAPREDDEDKTSNCNSNDEELGEDKKTREKLGENLADQHKYDRTVLQVVSQLESLRVHTGDRFMSLYESRFRVWAYCQYTLRRYYELTRRLVTIAYIPGDNTKYAIRHDVYKCRSPGCRFLIEVKIDEPTTDRPVMLWYVSRVVSHSCIVAQPTQENLKLFREGQGMHMCRYIPHPPHDNDLLLRLCWNTLKYSMHIMKRQLRRAQLCVTEHESMLDIPLSYWSLLVWISASAPASTETEPESTALFMFSPESSQPSRVQELDSIEPIISPQPKRQKVMN